MKSAIAFRSQQLTFAIAILFALARCGPAAAPTPSPAPTAVKVQLSWTHTIEWAGFYAAEEKGYYAEQGLSVTLLAGGSDAQGEYIDPAARLVAGQADFGVLSGSNLLQARSGGQPLVAIASIYQRHPLAFASLSASGIAKPQDLIGKKVQVSPVSMPLFRALLASQQIDPKQITLVERTDYTGGPLVSGEADVIDAWVINEVATLRLHGHEITTILPADYGVEEYPNVIVTTEKMIAEHPELVERFLRATTRGMQAAIDDPAAAAALALKHDPTLDLAEQTQGMQQSVPLLNPPGSKPGMMAAATWQTTLSILTQQAIIPQPVAVESAYTLRFLETIYQAK